MKRLSGLYLLLFIGIGWIMYRDTANAGFVTDWLGWEYKYKSGGWLDALRSFGYNGLHPVLHLLNYAMYSMFGKDGTAWQLLFVGIHGLNAWLAGSLYLRLDIRNSKTWGAVAVGLLVVLSPYATETVVWRVCLHYLCVLAFCLLGMHALLDYLYHSSKRTENYISHNPLKSLIWVHVCFLLSLFMLEWALVIPGMYAITIILFQLDDRQWNRKPWVLVIAVQAALIGGWFMLNKAILGQYVGHYGAETHFKFDLALMMSNTWKYGIKYALFARYWSGSLKDQAFALMEHPYVIIGIFLALILLIGYASFKIIDVLANGNRVVVGSRRLFVFGVIIMCLIALLPVINLYFYTLDFIETDRYGYFALPFFWMLAVYALSQFGKIGDYVIIAALVVSGYCLNKTTRIWQEADQQFKSLVQDFHHYDAKDVMILALPDNYRGAYMFRGGDSGFQRALELHTGKPYQGRMAEAVMYRADTQSDAVKCTLPDSTGMKYHISFVHNGSWWVWDGIGASDRETNWFRFIKQEWHGEVHLKEKKPGTVVLYPVQGKWQRAQ